MFKVLILDCEKATSNELKHLLVDIASSVDVIHEASTLEEALPLLENHAINLVFLNTDLPRKCIQRFFKAVDQFDFEIVLTLSAESNALKAFKSPAIDVLLKPIEKTALLETFARIEKRQIQKNEQAPQYRFKKLALPTGDGFAFLKIDQIVRCEASGNYSFFYTTMGQKILVSKTLKEYEDILQQHNFFRVHRSHLINLSYIRQYSKGKIPMVTLSDGTEISLSPSKRQLFLDLMLAG